MGRVPLDDGKAQREKNSRIRSGKGDGLIPQILTEICRIIDGMYHVYCILYTRYDGCMYVCMYVCCMARGKIERKRKRERVRERCNPAAMEDLLMSTLGHI